MPNLLEVYGTGCSLKIVFFLKILWFFWTLPILLQRWFSTCLVCAHTLTPRENRERQSPEHFKNFEKKNTIFNEHPVSQNKNCIFISDHSFHGYDEFTLQKKYFICNAYYQSRFVRQWGKIENYHYIGNQFWDKIFLFCI